MKKYQKAQMIAKNLPTGSYAAGCPSMYNSCQKSEQNGFPEFSKMNCVRCERQA